MLNGGKRIYRTGPWNGLWFSGVTEMATYSDMFIYRLTSSPSEITYGYVAKAGTPFSRLVLTDDGVFRRLVWEAGSRAWKIFQGPRDVCDQYGRCGAFGLCNASAPSTSFCSCVQGFSPASPVQWKMRDTSSGCRRNMALDCGNGVSGTTDGFVAVDGVKLPDTHNASVDASITLEECKARCLANCSCLAYAPLDMKGGGTGTGCIIWSEDLMDLRYVDGGQSMFLRSVKSELVAIHEGSGRSFPTGIVIGVSVTVPLVIILVLLAFWFTKCRRGRNREGVLDGRRVIDDVSPNNRALPLTSVRAVDLPAVIDATGNFSEENIIGEGGFGVVYKAELGGYGTVAVKRLNQDKLTNKIKEDFAREIVVMSRFKHDNLVELLSYCQEKDEWILVYELMQNSSLDVHIFATGQYIRRRATLTWERRVEIIYGTAKGVECLHRGSVIHRDLKPDNILLDDSWRPKVADFATAKPFIEDPTNLTVVQTVGYVAPEYSGENTLTYKCDVYSFGVVLLEIVSGERRKSKPTFLLDAWEKWNQREIGELLDPEVGEPEGENFSALARCIQIGLLCVQHSPEDRPDMSEVVTMLSETCSQLPMPRKPTANMGAGPSVRLMILDDTPGPSRAF